MSFPRRQRSKIKLDKHKNTMDSRRSLPLATIGDGNNKRVSPVIKKIKTRDLNLESYLSHELAPSFIQFPLDFFFLESEFLSQNRIKNRHCQDSVFEMERLGLSRHLLSENMADYSFPKIAHRHRLDLPRNARLIDGFFKIRSDGIQHKIINFVKNKLCFINSPLKRGGAR